MFCSEYRGIFEADRKGELKMREYAKAGIRIKMREILRIAVLIVALAALCLLAGGAQVLTAPVTVYVMLLVVRAQRAKARRADLLRALAPGAVRMADDRGDGDQRGALLSLYRFTLRRCALRVLLGGALLAAVGFGRMFFPGDWGLLAFVVMMLYGLAAMGVGTIRLLLSARQIRDPELDAALCAEASARSVSPREVLTGQGSAVPVLYCVDLGAKDMQSAELTVTALCRQLRGRTWLSVVGLVYLLIVAGMTLASVFFLVTDPGDAGTIAILFCTLIQYVMLAIIANSIWNPLRRFRLIMKISREGIELRPDVVQDSDSFQNPERTLMNLNPEYPQMLSYAVIGGTVFRCDFPIREGEYLTARFPGEDRPFCAIRTKT